LARIGALPHLARMLLLATLALVGLVLADIADLRRTRS